MYEVDPVDDLHGLPVDVLVALAELRTALAVSPGTVGRPWVATNPSGMRFVPIAQGRAFLVFGVLELERRVAIYDVVVV